jgi:hypothetical protein
MVAPLRITDADRDEHGRIIVAPQSPANDEPRSLVDLLPPMSSTVAAQPPAVARVELNRAQLVQGSAFAVVLVALVFVLTRGQTAPPAVLMQPTSAAQQSSAVATSAPATAVAVDNPIKVFFGLGINPAPDLPSSTQLRYLGRWGVEWVAVETPQNGRGWIARDDAQLDDAQLLARPDRSARPTAPAVQRVVQPVAPVVPTAVPTHCASVGTPDKRVEVCDLVTAQTLDQLQAAAQAKWIATYGGNVGEVLSASPVPKR